MAFFKSTQRCGTNLFLSSAIQIRLKSGRTILSEVKCNNRTIVSGSDGTDLRRQLHYDKKDLVQLQNSNITKNLYKNEVDLRNFTAIFPDLVNEVLSMKRYFSHPIIVERAKKLLEYTVLDGKKLRPMVFIAMYRSMLPKSEQLKEDELYLMYIMGWCLELYQAFLTVLDDMIDDSTRRRGRKCWHLKQAEDGNGSIALAMNDCNLLNDLIYLILQRYFSEKTYYINVVELFHRVSIKTINAQTLDILISSITKKSTDNKFESFSMDMYRKLAINKTSYQTFVCPFETAAFMNNVQDEDLIRKARDILLEMGVYYQAKNDYHDCFSSSNITGATGIDIETGKCTWLISTALARATQSEKEILNNYYGTTAENAFRVKEMYNNMQIPALYRAYEKEIIDKIRSRISTLSDPLVVDTFENIFQSITEMYEK